MTTEEVIVTLVQGIFDQGRYQETRNVIKVRLGVENLRVTKDENYHAVKRVSCSLCNILCVARGPSLVSLFLSRRRPRRRRRRRRRRFSLKP